jgi:hypothetical protein
MAKNNDHDKDDRGRKGGKGKGTKKSTYSNPIGKPKGGKK